MFSSSSQQVAGAGDVLITPEQADAELAETRRTKIAVVEDGYNKGISGVATFAQDDSGGCFALGVTVPTVRFFEQVDHLRRALRKARPEFQRIVAGR